MPPTLWSGGEGTLARGKGVGGVEFFGYQTKPIKKRLNEITKKQIPQNEQKGHGFREQNFDSEEGKFGGQRGWPTPRSPAK